MVMFLSLTYWFQLVLLPLAIALAIAAAITLVIGILGHATLVANEKFISVSNLLVMILVVALAAKSFHVHQAHAEYALGSFWSTWRWP